MGDAGIQNVSDNSLIQPRQKANTLFQCAVEIQLAIHRALCDVCDPLTYASFGGQFIDAFLTDHRRIHIGKEHLFATFFGRLDHQIDPIRLQVGPNIPKIRRLYGHFELRCLINRQPDRVATAPRITERFHQWRFDFPLGWRTKKGDGEHRTTPVTTGFASVSHIPKPLPSRSEVSDSSR